MRRVDLPGDISQEQKMIQRQLCELFELEEIMARLRSRVDWLREGDRNTSFFQAHASTRRRTNRIRYLLKEDGSRCEEKAVLLSMARGFLNNVFTSEPSFAMDAILDAIPSRVTHDINEDLMKEYSYDYEEIKTTLF